MVNATQLDEIRNYLLLQKLPIDILMEVQDHIITQIEDIQKNQDLDFDTAFAKAKDSWRKDLRPYWNGSWDLEDRNDLVRNFEKSIWINFSKQSLKWGLLSVFLLGGLANLISYTLFSYVVLAFFVVLVLGSILRVILSWKTFRLPNQYYAKYILTLYQSYAMMPLSLGYFLFKLIACYQEISLSYFSVFANHQLEWKFIFMIVLSFVGVSICIFSIICQNVYLNRMEKVKPFLEKLQ